MKERLTRLLFLICPLKLAVFHCESKNKQILQTKKHLYFISTVTYVLLSNIVLLAVACDSVYVVLVYYYPAGVIQFSGIKKYPMPFSRSYPHTRLYRSNSLI